MGTDFRKDFSVNKVGFCQPFGKSFFALGNRPLSICRQYLNPFERISIFANLSDSFGIKSSRFLSKINPTLWLVIPTCFP